MTARIFPPLLIALAALAWIATHYAQIPLRYGNHLTTRTPRHVFALPVFGFGITLLLVTMVAGIRRGSPQTAKRQPMEDILLALAYLLSVVFSEIGLRPLLLIPAWIIPATILLMAIATIAYVARVQSRPDDSPSTTPPECWSLGSVYYNPDDPALFVPAQFGDGYTLNMANPWSRRIMAGFLVSVGLLVALLIWALR